MWTGISGVVSVYSRYMADTLCFILIYFVDTWSVWNRVLEGYLFTTLLFQFLDLDCSALLVKEIGPRSRVVPCTV